MKLHKNFIVAVALIFAFSVNIQAQPARLYKANLLYDAMSYAEAIPKYVKVIKNDSANSLAKIRLADCYRLTNDIQKSVVAYEEIVKKHIGKPIHKFYYAQALMATGNYEEAKKYMAEYKVDERGETFTRAMQQIQKFFKDSACYAIQNLPFNSNLNDFSPSLLDNKIVFASSRKRSYMVNHISTWTDNNYFNLYYTIRKADGKFTKVHRFAHSLDNRYNDGPVSFSRQGKTIYVTRNNISEHSPVRASDGQVKLQLYYATLNKRSNGYEYISEFEYNNKEYNVAHPAINPDGTKLFISSDMPGSLGGMDLWVCVKEGETWSKPKNLGPMINTKGNDVFPYLTGNTLFFSSNGLEGIGGLDIFMVTLDDKGTPSGKPYNIGIPINSTGDDFGVAYYEDGKAGYMSSNRKALNMDDDIYGFTYNAAERTDIKITGIVTDNETSVAIPEAKVLLLNENDEVIEELITNENGNYSFNVDPNQKYTIKASKEDYLDVVKQVNTATEEKIKVFTADIPLEKDPGLILNIVVTDSRTNIPLKDVKVEILDMVNGNNYNFLTTANGDYSMPLIDKKVGNDLNYTVKLSKDGYFNKNSTFTYKISAKGIIRMLQTMDNITNNEIIYPDNITNNKTIYPDKNTNNDVSDNKLNVGPIYFDFDKYNIRSDAAVNLNKVFDIMNNNPQLIIQLMSYTDCRGSAEYNMRLSENRAKSSYNYLINKGISKNRLSAKGYGETRPVNGCSCEGAQKSNCSEEQHQLNRRTEFIIKK